MIATAKMITVPEDQALDLGAVELDDDVGLAHEEVELPDDQAGPPDQGLEQDQAEDRPPDRADAAGQAATADDRGGDREQLVRLAQLRAGLPAPAGEQDARQRGQEPRRGRRRTP